MLIYIPILRYGLRKDFRSRKLYVTPNTVVYKGVFKKEKHILLSSVADVVIEQGHLESYFGIYSIRIENVGVSRPLSDDLHIQGIASPITFRKVILTRLHSMWDKRFYDQISTKPDMLGQCSGHLRASMPSSSSCKNEDLVNEEVILQKLEEVESHVKNVQNLIEKKSLRDDVS
ncbi:hypothetical protein ZOSMA_176G00260 [Zostera marina]|uniref:DUF7642 domain-containing protein n=1 Tax=Zostera marina TaxID=29655 RepID=A0A0K9PU30_ZOSMR|nr:hypothetical protein ZOSMA_176G00260 [Zostera marina]